VSSRHPGPVTLRRARDLAATALLPAVLVLLLVLSGCGDVGGPGDTDPVRDGAGAETTREAWVVEGEDDLTQAEIDELALEEWREARGPGSTTGTATSRATARPRRST
jgi:hypothetical protein